MSTNALAVVDAGFSQEQIDIIRSQVAPDGTTTDELALFLQYCQRTGLDPFARQIYLSERRSQDRQGNWVVTRKPETTIDGFRLLAERSQRYAGQLGPFWCDEDGVWRDVWIPQKAPVAARVGVLRHDFKEPLWAVALYDEYVQTKRDGSPNSMWTKMPANQLAKCFTPDTQILTTNGFERFDSVKGIVLEVSPEGLRKAPAAVFSQDYEGPMIASNGDMLNFSVTPNHDMVTTFGKVEAMAMYETCRSRARWFIPMTIEGNHEETVRMPDEDLRLVGYVVADGSWNQHQKWLISVSRPHKIEVLESLSPAAVNIIHSRGAVALTGTGREIRSNFDKKQFTFDIQRCSPLLGTDKGFAFSMLPQLSKRQARLVLDSWISFDGYTNKKTGVRRLYTSRRDHLAAAEILGVTAGYSVNVPRERHSDISSKPGYSLTVSEPKPAPVNLPIGNQPGIVIEHFSGKVWCVTVPSGRIVVRRNGFSMVCGNCAESLALRRAFPRELSGLYTREEMPDPKEEGREAQREYLASKGIGIDAATAGSRPVVSGTDGREGVQKANREGSPGNVKSPSISPALIRELSEELDKPPSPQTIEMRHASQVAEAEAILKAEKKSKRKKGGVTFDVLKYFGEVKKLLREVTGDDTQYYAILRANGHEHADAIADNDKAREIYKAMLLVHKHATEDKRLRAELAMAEETYKDAFWRVLGNNGADSIDAVLGMDSEHLETVRRELKELGRTE